MQRNRIKCWDGYPPNIYYRAIKSKKEGSTPFLLAFYVRNWYNNTNNKLGENARMINFEEELRKFSPSTEVEQAEDMILKLDSAHDLTDLMLEIMKDKES